MSERHDDLQMIIDGALEDMAAEAGGGFDPQRCNLAEFCRRTGLTRSKARTIKSHGFKAPPHGNAGRKAAVTVLTGHTGLVDDQLRRGVTNSQVIFDRLRAQGYEGGLTTARAYVAGHRDLVPPKRRQPSPQGSRGRRLGTGPGEAYQMDRGFVAVLGLDGRGARSRASRWSATTAASSTSSSFPTPGRRTPSSAWSTRSRRWGCPTGYRRTT